MVTRYLLEKMGKVHHSEWEAIDREAARRARQDAERAAIAAPISAPDVPSRREDDVPAKRQPAKPELSREQRAAQSAMLRHACDWFALHHLCANANCRRAKGCRGEPMACLRAGVPQVPESARTFVRLMIEGQELGLDFDEAFEDAEDFRDGWAAWIAGLEAAGRAR